MSAPDIRTHAATRDLTESYSSPFNVCSLLDTPIRSGGKLIGIICCEQTAVQKYWSREEENFAVSLAGILAGYFEWEERQAAFSELKETKEEIEDLNQFTYLVNSLSELDDIFTEIHKYVYIKFNIANTWLFLPDEKKENLFSYKAYSYNEALDDRYEGLKSKKIPLTETEGGLLNLIFRRKKPFYIDRVTKFSSLLDREFTEALSLKSFLYVPLVRKDKCAGIFAFGSHDENMNITKSEIRKLSNVCSQIAGAVDTKNLLQLVEKAKQETETLNRLIKSLNEDLNIRNIMNKVLQFVKENFGINFYALYNANSEKTSISLLDINFPEYITEDDRKKIFNFRIPVQNAKGPHAYAFKTKRPLYLPEITSHEGTKEELFILNKFKIESILLMPLLLNNEMIGILDFSDSEVMKLTEEDITKISILSEQLAGIIYGSNLFKEAKIQAEIDRGIAFMAQREAEQERSKSEKLLLNILPIKIADELKENGYVEPVYFENASIMFTDFKGFTRIAEELSPPELIRELDVCFSIFDQIVQRNGLEKLKTIGDGYMCAGGIPEKNSTHAADCCLAALAIQTYMNQFKEFNRTVGGAFLELRLGINSGPVIAGVIGERKFAYDVWGDTVNTASRMESSGTPGRINVSGSTYDLTKHLFDFEYRGKVTAKNKGEVDMYYLTGIKALLSKDDDRKTPNEKFWEHYKNPVI
ncbi:MAG TPA: adenylate/guanylate cyclase domain-containing protein [Leptospiraceae bacterium]|nr:adenylate/guanylate cyclase domain-containing protein [Leptospiraceae bacterium]HMY67813.1 adenylate/guanylate cyclase domain-containing protein [Leptospiraceae bacterium]HNF24642.1 adenylate/guanylate cyclase domain-containing protein [Leptospiraceae bacterium]HNM03570.1 adenylate/guanylate cyclase domain-containing protein [Leptospiraceae bacterium]HNN02092.1 adenylate/guanylate cyclase domain-containing protein [Leptospiraceae bacterium]